VVSQLWIEIEKHKYKCKKLQIYNNALGPSLSDTYKTAKFYFVTSWAVDIIKTAYYILGP